MFTITPFQPDSISLARQTTWIQFGRNKISLDYLHALAEFLMQVWKGEYKHIFLEDENFGIDIEIGGHDSDQHGRKHLDPGIMLIGSKNDGTYVESVNRFCRSFLAMQAGDYRRTIR